MYLCVCVYVNPHHHHYKQDHRPLDTVIKDLLHDGFIPSFCTACYRKVRPPACP